MPENEQQTQEGQTDQTQTGSETNQKTNDQQKPPIEGSEKDVANILAEEPEKVEGKEGEAKDAKDGKDAKPVIPDKYEFKVPDGYELDEKVSEEAQALFKSHGLTQEGAQAMLDFHVKTIGQAAEAPYELWADTQAGWVKEIKADPEIGGPKLEQVVKPAISQAIDLLGKELAPAFRQAMIFTGAGNNPAFVRGFYKLAQMVTEGKHVDGGNPSEGGQQQPGGAPKTAAQRMYPNLP